jgi:methyl-accepting chemotaxis protein
MSLTTALSPETLDLKLLLHGMNDLKKGDLSVSLPSDWTGLPGKIADTFNDLVQINRTLAQELERLTKDVAKEGKIKERASLANLSGAWAGMASSVNTLVDELVRPTSEMSRVMGAVAKGDLSQTVDLEVGGRPPVGEFFN